MQLNITTKMGQNAINKSIILFLITWIALPSHGMWNQQKETHKLLVTLNKNWTNLKHELEFTYSPSSEQELIQLHLFNVVSFLESQDLNQFNELQKKNRIKNIETLKKYSLDGQFPINRLTDYRTPIFIDSRNVYCAVGFLMKESGNGKIAQEIAESQLLFYLNDINHPQLENWQKSSGFSLFELALIQPTYGPPTPVCGSPTPIPWKEIERKDSYITKIVESNYENLIYGIAEADQLGLNHKIVSYSPEHKEWTDIGSPIKGQILDLLFIDQQIYISVLLPEENFPHQILKMNGEKWEKIAHFDGSIKSIQAFQNKLYVLGNFKKVNDSIHSSLVVIDANSIHSFSPIGIKNNAFDHIKASETALFLTSYGGIYKFKNDTITYLSGIKYYHYLTEFTTEAVEDTFYVSAVNIPGFNKYFDSQEHTVHNNNVLRGRATPYYGVNITQTSKIKGNMYVSGDFKSSTLRPQINDNRQLVHCEDTASLHWYGEGLMIQSNQTFYPILNEGVVLNYIQLNNRIYILKNDGSIHYAELGLIEKEINKMEVRRNQN